jgi:hypothetical protein
MGIKTGCSLALGSYTPRAYLFYPKIFGFKYKDSIERNYKTRRERKE